MGCCATWTARRVAKHPTPTLPSLGSQMLTGRGEESKLAQFSRWGRKMKRLGYALALVVFVLDQLSKYWIVHVVGLQQRGWVPVTPFLTLTWVANIGVSMGLFPASGDTMRWVLVAGTGAIAALVAVWIGREQGRWDALALGLVLGGALGNILDRIRLGYVVDFVHVAYGAFDFRYVFNVADAAISTGVVLLLARALLGAKPAAVRELP